MGARFGAQVCAEESLAGYIGFPLTEYGLVSRPASLAPSSSRITVRIEISSHVSYCLVIIGCRKRGYYRRSRVLQ